MAKAKTPKARKPKQGHLEGMEPPVIPEIEDASDRFVAARGKWQRLLQPMLEAKAILEALMRQHGLKRYEYDEKIIEFVVGEKIKVGVKKPEKPETVDVAPSANGDGDDDDGDDSDE